MSDFRISNSASPPAYPTSRNAGAEAQAVAEQPAKVERQPAKPLTPAEVNRQEAKAPTSAKEAKRLSEELQRRVGGADSQLQFTVDEATGESVIKVTDKATNEVIRQIPSEEMLQIAKALDRFQENFLVNSKA